jgi:hypothetical protein
MPPQSDHRGLPMPHARRGLYLRAACFACLIVAPVLVILGATMARRPPAAAPGSKADTPAATSPAIAPVAGPWGELDVAPLTLEPPAEMMARFTQLDDPLWYFRQSTPATVDEQLKAAGLADAERHALLQTCTAALRVDGASVRPSPALVFGLRPEVREAIYNLLWATPANRQSEPFRRVVDAPGNAGDWFADCAIGGENLALARKLLYRRGGLECFVDVSAMLSVLHGDDERARLFSTLSRQSSLSVKVRVPSPGADLRPLVDYWGKNGRDREVAAALASAQQRGEATVDVTKLLPPFAATRLNAYPQAPGKVINGPEDCHYTSLNFWNDAADERFLNADVVVDTLLAGFHPIDKAAQLGDLVLFVNRQGKGIHSAVYVAADIYFTKNGSNVAAPWMLMRYEDLSAYYGVFDVERTMSFRPNGW